MKNTIFETTQDRVKTINPNGNQKNHNVLRYNGDIQWQGIYLLDLSQLPEKIEGYKHNANRSPGDGGIEPYSGSPKFSELERFVTTVCLDYALRGLGGPGIQRDKVRMMHLVYYLRGEAKNLIVRHVMSATRTKEDWTFEKCLCTLYDRFVRPTSTQEARENLKKTKYKPEAGVQEFYDNLKEHASNMTVHPDNYYLVELLTGSEYT